MAQKTRSHMMTRHDVLELMNKRDDELLHILIRTSFGFENFLKNKHYFTRNEKIDFEVFESILEASYRVCTIRQSNTLGSIHKFLRSLTNFDTFLFADVLKVINFCLEHSRKSIDLASFTKHYLVVLKMIVKTKLGSSQQIIDFTFPALQNIINEMANLRIKNMEDTKTEYEKLKFEIEKSGEPSYASDEDEDEVQSFRKLSIVPKDNDVINVFVPDLPCNIVDGPYKSVNHYLSVHFRLMREDMLRSFRECIKICENPGEAYKSGCRLYDLVNVRFPPVYTPDGITYKIDVKTNRAVDWAKKEVLMPGNMVCLTHDKFRSVIFAIISKEPRADKNTRRECQTEIRLEDTCVEINTDVHYLMFETSAYFECYKHVLGAIRDFDKKSLPLSDILALLDYEKPEPEYLVDPKLKNKKYCLHEKCNYSLENLTSTSSAFEGENNIPLEQLKIDPPLLKDEIQFQASCKFENHDGKLAATNEVQFAGQQLKDKTSEEDDFHPCKEFNPLDYSKWPAAGELEMDDQQLAAFQTALTKKVAVIQGPPGTGKTYIGVKVVKALLQNVTLTPIIICCMTNHALDQFLEHILKFTRNIVRLGSQSKSKVLQPHTLENLVFAQRANFRDKKSSLLKIEGVLKDSLDILKTYAPALLHSKATGEYDQAYFDLLDVCNNINKFYRTLCLCEDEYLKESALNEIIDSRDKDQLREGSTTHSKALSTSVMEWLCCSRDSSLYERCKTRFQKLKSLEILENESCFDLWSLDLTTRFQLFYIWREKCLSVLRQNIVHEKEIYKQLKMRYNGRLPDPLNIDILMKANVIGVTTTGAAKFRKLLRHANPAILIVEEAAEVLESHIIASLLPTTQHLILIGDHKQLRPIPANHDLSENYNLKISMFERLFQNNAPSATLESQHRMKPCIADLLVQDELYTDLKSFKNVYEYENIRGVKSSVFFLYHSKSEDAQSSSTSSSNEYEARMIVTLAKYLTFQSYTEDQLTILATYSAQVPLIQSHLLEQNLEIKVTTVDNFQGEENEIILVSFVRNNMSGAIGFLKENNRVCVALSRAKQGMFCLGNFSSYAARSPLWRSIVSKLEKQDMIGSKLPLMCSKHAKETFVETPEDIFKFIMEGCDELCGFQLPCGHTCSKKCHFIDPDHLRYDCLMPCEKYIAENKKCDRMCYMRCKKTKKATVTLSCGHFARFRRDGSVYPVCQEEEQQCLPCNHIDTLPCSTDASQYKCKKLISVILSCGHRKDIYCHRSNNFNNIICSELTPRLGPCGHTVHVPCCLKMDEMDLLPYCKNACDTLLTCGHSCTGLCRLCFDVGIHALCTEKCEERLNCGHSCDDSCHTPCPPCKRTCLLSCSHRKECINSCYRPCIACEKKCARQCSHVMCTKVCDEECSVDPCTFPCSEILPCGHKCIGYCGDPCPYLCRVCNDSDLDSGDPKSDFYIQLDDCDHVIAVNELNEHIDTCLECFMWPDCPVCKKPVRRSMRYKSHLLRAKETVLKSSDNSEEIDNVHYLLNSIVSTSSVIPAEFLAVHKKIAQILHRDQPSSSILFILKNCVISLRNLILISEKLKEMDTSNEDSSFQNRFETLLLWIYYHLECASYQQLNELDKAIDELKSHFTWN